MAVVQSTYASSISDAVAGMVANMETANKLTRLCEDSGGVGFGKALFQGTNDNQVTATASTAFIGISMKDVTAIDSTADTYPQYDNVSVLNKGVIWVLAGGTVAAGEAVYVDGSGNFVESASGATALSGVTFDSSGVDGDLVRIRLG